MTAHERLQRQLIDALRRAMAGGNPIVPEAGRLLWRFFVEMSAARSYHMGGPNPISWVEIQAWARVRRWPVSDTHISILRAMDDAWLEYAARKAKQSGKGGKDEPTRVKAEMTPTAFDGMFKR